MGGKLLFLIVLLVLIIGNIPYVSAQEPDNEHVNILELPKHVSEALGIPEFASQLLVCSIFMMMILLPIAIFSKGNLILSILVGFVLMGFFIAVGWMPFWLLLILALIIASLWANKIKEWVS
jgi:hypothetical protein